MHMNSKAMFTLMTVIPIIGFTDYLSSCRQVPGVKRTRLMVSDACTVPWQIGSRRCFSRTTWCPPASWGETYTMSSWEGISLTFIMIMTLILIIISVLAWIYFGTCSYILMFILLLKLNEVCNSWTNIIVFYARSQYFSNLAMKSCVFYIITILLCISLFKDIRECFYSIKTFLRFKIGNLNLNKSFLILNIKVVPSWLNSCALQLLLLVIITIHVPCLLKSYFYNNILS